MRRLLLKATEAGQKLEPKNAYFALLHAGAQMASGNRRVAFDEYLAASKLGYYRDYATREPAVVEAAIAENHGEPDQVAKLWIRSSLLLPHLNAIRALGRELSVDWPDRSSDLIRASAAISDSMLRAGDLAATCLVAVSVFHSALPKGAAPRSATAALDRESGGAYYSSIELRAAAVKGAAARFTSSPGWYKDFETLTYWRPRVSASALAGLLLAFPMACVVALGARRKLGAGTPSAHAWMAHLVLQAALVVFVSALVFAAHMPSAGLLGALLVAAVAASAVSLIFVPAGRISGPALGALSMATCLVLYLLFLAGDMRAQGAAANFIDAVQALDRQTSSAALGSNSASLR